MKILRAALVIIGLVIGAPAMAADTDYPNRLVTIVVPYAPGGATDIVARVLAEQLHKVLGRPMIVSNRAGGFGLIAMQEVLLNPADGYTLMIGNVSTNGITPVLYADKVSFDYGKSFAPVTKLADLPGVLLATGANFAPKTLAEVIAFAKANPDKINYASPGVGSYVQFDTEILSQRAGIRLFHVPFKGGASEMLTSLARGDTQIGFLNVASAEGMVKSGMVRALAVVADQRVSQFPDVPTMAEAGFPGIGTQQWQGMYVKAGTPQEIVDKLYTAVAAVMKHDEVAKLFKANGIRVNLSASSAAAAEWQKSELARWRKMAEQVHISLE